MMEIQSGLRWIEHELPYTLPYGRAELGTADMTHPGAASGREDTGERLLDGQQVSAFERDGFLLIPNFYAVSEIDPIRLGIYQIIGFLLEKYSLPVDRPPYSSETFDAGYQELISHDRRVGGEVYDAIKQIPAFVRLSCLDRHEAIFCQLRNTQAAGIASAGNGIRIDNPFEERYRQPWHQDYHSQLRSQDGLVFWSPLVPLTREMGPVQFCVGSHKKGPGRVLTRDPRHPEKTGTYGLILADEAACLASYPQSSPLPQPGDLVLIDFLTIHASGFNRSDRPRWSMQLRFFNFSEPTGIRIGWKGSFGSGVDLRSIHPELIAD